MIYLASQSPRRAELLTALGVPFRVTDCAYEECLPERHPDPPALAKEMARAKATEPLNRCAADIVITADTIVFLEDEILGKPADEDEARAMLRRLSGRWHEVASGLCVGRQHDGTTDLWCDVAVTRVLVAALTERQIAAYVATGEPLDKAGAYGIQGRFGACIDRIDGCYSNVVGLSLPLAARLLRLAGMEVADCWSDVG